VLKCALFATLLLKAGQPLQPSAPPVPLHLPPPGQLPVGVWSAATYVAPAVGCDITPQVEGDVRCSTEFEPAGAVIGGRLRLVGREALRAFWYSPHALQMVAP
jgi:hypothetical protein